MKEKKIIFALVASNILMLGLGLFFWLSSRGTAGAPDVVDKKTGESLYLKDQVKNTIIKNSLPLQQCYIELLSKKPKKEQGTLKIDWQIDTDGKPLDVQRISNEFGTDEPAVALEKCAVDNISTWHFPDPPGGRKFYVAHTFLFGEQKKQPPEMINTPRAEK